MGHKHVCSSLRNEYDLESRRAAERRESSTSAFGIGSVYDFALWQHMLTQDERTQVVPDAYVFTDQDGLTSQRTSAPVFPVGMRHPIADRHDETDGEAGTV